MRGRKRGFGVDGGGMILVMRIICNSGGVAGTRVRRNRGKSTAGHCASFRGCSTKPRFTSIDTRDGRWIHLRTGATGSWMTGHRVRPIVPETHSVLPMCRKCVGAIPAVHRISVVIQINARVPGRGGQRRRSAPVCTERTINWM